MKCNSVGICRITIRVSERVDTAKCKRLRKFQAKTIQNERVVTATVLAVPKPCFVGSHGIMKCDSVGICRIAIRVSERVDTAKCKRLRKFQAKTIQNERVTASTVLAVPKPFVLASHYIMRHHSAGLNANALDFGERVETAKRNILRKFQVISMHINRVTASTVLAVPKPFVLASHYIMRHHSAGLNANALDFGERVDTA
jgi:spore coat protein U-like protein